MRTTFTLREFGIRVALGGSRSRLLRQCLTESLLLSLLGGALALPIARWSVTLLGRVLLGDLPPVTSAIDYRVLTFTLGCAVATALGIGAIPAWLAARGNSRQELMGAAGRVTDVRTPHRLRYLLLSVGAMFADGLTQFVRNDPG